MGKKKGTKQGGDAKKEAKSKGDGENKKEDGENGVTAVLKMDMHCEGCADKIVKLAKSIDGVERAKAEWEANKLTVRGEMLDPLKLREKLQEKTKKKVDLVSPQLPKKEKDRDNKSSASSDNSSSNNKAKDKKPEDKKPKEPPVTTAVLKLNLHCAGCIAKIYKIASKTKGVRSISFDKDKDLVEVMGAVDAKALVESLREKIKRPVEVVQPKKDKDGGGEGEGGGGGGKKNKKGGGNGGKEGGDDGGGGGGGNDDGAEEGYGGTGEYFGGNRMEYNGVPPGYVYNYGFMYGNPGDPLPHAPQIFSDENPNACHVM